MNLCLLSCPRPPLSLSPVYLLLGLMAMLLLLQTFHKAADLHGLTNLVLVPRDSPSEDQQRILESHDPPGQSPTEKAPVQAPHGSGGQVNYSSISR